MAVVKIRRDEMEIVKEASRIERRSNSRFVIDRSRIEISDDSEGVQQTNLLVEGKPVLTCD